MLFLRRFFFLLLSLFLSHLALAQDDFLPPEKAFAPSVILTTPTQATVHFEVAQGYYLYLERFKFKAIDSHKQSIDNVIGKPTFPTPEDKYDPTFERTMQVYHHSLDIQLPLTPTKQAITLSIVSQGCADAGLCYPPQTYQVNLLATSQGYQLAPDTSSFGFGNLFKPQQNTASTSVEQDVQAQSTTTPQPDNTTLLSGNDTQIAQWLDQSNLISVIVICFALGVLLSLTPCVLPMLPILLSLIVGQQQKNTPTPKRQALTLTLVYILGTSIVYTLLGLIAASVGSALSAWLQTPWVVGFFALLLLVLAIALLANFNFQAPSGLQNKLHTWLDKIPGGRYGGAFLMGLISALIVGPCVAAPLAGVLLFISQTGNLLLGALALFFLAWGQGVSLIILGTGSSLLLPKAGAWMNTIKILCALLLLATAVWLISPFISTYLILLAWAFLAIAFAYSVGLFSPFKEMNLWALVGRALGFIATIWAILLLIGIASDNPDPLHPLKGLMSTQNVASSNQTHKPFVRIHSLKELDQQLASHPNQVAMLDFYADWCVVCKEMEAFTLNQAPIVQRLDQMLLLQADVTANNADDQALLKRFKLFGPPGTVFFDRQGHELSTRVVGFQNAKQFVQNLDKVLTPE